MMSLCFLFVWIHSMMIRANTFNLQQSEYIITY